MSKESEATTAYVEIAANDSDPTKEEAKRMEDEKTILDWQIKFGVQNIMEDQKAKKIIESTES